MHQRILLLAALSALALPTLACQRGADDGAGRTPSTAGPPPVATPGSGEVAARISGVPITTDEIDARAREELFRARADTPSKLYELRSQTLETMLGERVLAVVAEQRGTTPEELIATEVETMGPVEDAEARAFFDEHAASLGNVEYEEVKGQIFDFLASRRPIDAVARLREAADVEILLEPPRIEVAATGPSDGPDDARVTIVEFSDFQCPFCRRVLPTLKTLRERYPEDVRIVYRNFPLRSHSRAQAAAEAALCAEELGQFWPYHDVLFANSRKLDDADLRAYAEQVGLDPEAFGACLDEHRYATQVSQDLQDGRAAGVTGTPAFFVNGVMLSGARPPEDFVEVIDAELARE